MSQASCRRLALHVLAAAGTCFGNQAHADEAGRSGAARVYDVAPTCPSHAAWSEGLQARLPLRLRTHPAIQRFAVHIQRQRSSSHAVFQYAGQLGWVSEAPGVDARSVRGASCHEVAEALTLIAALEVRHLVSETPELASPEWALTAEQELFLSQEQDVVGASASPLEGGELRVGAAGFGLLQVAAPRLAPGAGLGATLQWRTEGLQPWVMLGVYWAGAGETAVSGATARARFELWSSHVVACPVRFPMNSSAAFRPCLDVDIGRLTGTGSNVDGAAQPSALWASSGVQLRLEWLVLERIQLGAMLGGVVPLSRPRFYFLPEVTVFDVPSLGLRAGTSASVLF